MSAVFFIVRFKPGIAISRTNPREGSCDDSLSTARRIHDGQFSLFRSDVSIVAGLIGTVVVARVNRRLIRYQLGFDPVIAGEKNATGSESRAPELPSHR